MLNLRIRTAQSLIWLFLLSGLAAAGAAYWLAESAVQQELGSRLQVRANRASHIVKEKLQLYGETLRGLQTHFILHPDLTRHDFRQVYRALALGSRLEGVQAVGYSVRVAAEARPAFDQEFRRELNKSDPDYAAGFQPAPVTAADSYIVRYVEHVGTNYPKFGIDQGNDDRRRAAIEHARDTGELTVSGRVRLLVRPVDGVVFFLPLYRGGEVPSTLEQRRAEFAGVLFISTRIDEMLHSVFGPSNLTDLDIEVFDVHADANSTAGKAAPAEHNMVFDSARYLGVQKLHTRNGAFPLQRMEDIRFGDISWQLHATALPGFLFPAQRWLPWLAALVAALLTVVTFFFMRMLEGRRRAAEHQRHGAQQMLRAKEQQLEHQSRQDMLTGLANRNHLCKQIDQRLSQAGGQEPNLWVLCIDLDRFKLINDMLGHEAGDVLLDLMGQRLQAALHPGDMVARIAGNEFVVVLRDVRDQRNVTTIAQRIMNEVARPVTVKGHEHLLTCSVGVAAYPDDGGDTDTLIKHASIAMRRAKDAGRNTVQFYTAALNQRAMDRLQLERDLRHALQRNEMVLHYQPQVDLSSGRMVGMEALLRWQHPQLGMISPARFIPLAEETGLISSIGAWALRTACQQNRAWQDAGYAPMRIGVNLSANQFYQSDLVRSVAVTLQETGLQPEWLDLEFTESLMMTDVTLAMEVMHKLKALGVKLSLDDFGTGYSSLAYLRRFPIDVLKIDQSFIQNVASDPDDAAIAASIITLARNLRLQIIAEGVETEEQLAYLRRQRCDQIQGYYFSRPVPAQELEQLLAEDRRLPVDGNASAAFRQR